MTEVGPPTENRPRPCPSMIDTRPSRSSYSVELSTMSTRISSDDAGVRLVVKVTQLAPVGGPSVKFGPKPRKKVVPLLVHEETARSVRPTKLRSPTPRLCPKWLSEGCGRVI